MSETISGYHNATITLTSGTPAVTITSTGTVNGQFGQGIYLDSAGTVSNAGTIIGGSGGIVTNETTSLASTIFNDGTIESTGTDYNMDGIRLDAGGTITNNSSGLISGYVGIYLTSGVVDNQSGGSITETGFGVTGFGQNITIINAGEISGERGDGIVLTNLTGSNSTSKVVNTGTILSDGYNGVILGGGGYLTNKDLIEGYFNGVAIGTGGIYQGALAGSLNNSGTIEATSTQTNFSFIDRYHSGVNLSPSVALTNSGLIESTGFGVIGSEIFNSGTIEGTGGTFTILGTAELSTGIEMLDGGSVTNASSGLISGEIGIELTGSGNNPNVIDNSGTILAADYGIDLLNNASVTSSPAPVIITNSGLIEATARHFTNQNGGYTGGAGIILAGNDTVVNQLGGSISGYNGIFAFGANDTVTNDGYISGAGTYSAIFLADGGQVTNHGTILTEVTPGTLNAAFGVNITGDGNVANYGLITGNGGVQFLNISSYVNTGILTNSGTIDVLVNGVAAYGVATVTNSGLINATETTFTYNEQSYIAAGVKLSKGGLVTNTGAIFGGGAGVIAYGGTSIFNSGTIESTGTGVLSVENSIGGTLTLGPAGIDLLGGGTITNATGGMITGEYGVYITGTSGASAAIVNAGSITGTYYGVEAFAAATITNSGLIESTTRQHFTDKFGGSFGGAGVALIAGGTLINQLGGTIIGYNGVSTSGTNVSVINFGYITGENGYSAVYLNTPGDVTNYGTIHTQPTFNGAANGAGGVGLVLGGTVSNASTGLIDGGGGVYFKTAGSFNNSGRVIDESSAFSALGVAAVTNNGLLEAESPTFVFAGHTYISAGAALTGGVLTNAGTILSSNAGIISYGASASILNSGIIETTGTGEVSAQNPVAGTLALDPTGIALLAGGTITNTSSGLITGVDGIVIEGSAGSSAYIANAGSVVGTYFGIAATAFTSIGNSGLIEGTSTTLVTFAGEIFAGIGVDLAAGGAITNQSTGTISGAEEGIIFATYASLSSNVNNGGLIEATGSIFDIGGVTIPSIGVFFADGGTLTNNATGTIIGYGAGIQSFTHLSTAGENARNALVETSITNSGVIEGGDSDTVYLGGGATGSSGGVVLDGGGELTNESTGRISGNFGVYVNGGSSSISNFVDNLGSIEGVVTAGAILGQHASLVNDGHITGEMIGVSAFAGNSATNQSSGIISGGQFGVYFSDGGTLTNAGTITGNGGTAVYFAASTSGEAIIDPGAVFNGTVYDAAGNGVLDLASAATNGTLSGIGSEYIGFSQITIDSGADWTLAGTNSISAGQTLSDYGTLVVDGAFANNGVVQTDPSTITFTGDITGTGEIIVGTDSVIVFDGSVSSGETIVFVDNTGTVFVNDPAGFHASVVGDGTVITACFAAGTHILTPQGEIPVENLSAGDMVITHDGDDAPVKWIGRRTLDLTRHPQPEKAQPIRIAAGALGENTPSRDLLLSPDHALYLRSHLVPAKALRNFSNITQLNRRSVTYYHIELDHHSVIFAEGAAVETYLETGNRHAFENGGVAVILHPDFVNTDFQAMREAQSCAPFAEHGPVVDGIRRAILRRVYASRTG